MTFEAGRLVDPATGATKTSGTVVLETTSPLAGIASARVVNSSTAYLERSWTAADDAYVVASIRFTTLPSAAVRVLQVSDLGTTVGNLQLQVNGALRLRDGSTIVGVDSPPLVAGTTYRIAIHQRRGTGSNGLLEAFVTPVGMEFGSPFATKGNGTWTTGADRLRIGATSGGAIDVTMDDVLVDGAVMPSASSTTASAGATTTALAASAATGSSTDRTQRLGSSGLDLFVCLLS